MHVYLKHKGKCCHTGKWKYILNLLFTNSLNQLEQHMQQHFLKMNSTAVGNRLTQFLSTSQNIAGPVQRNKLNKNSQSLILFKKCCLYFYIHLLIRLLRVALQVEVHTPMTSVIVFFHLHTLPLAHQVQKLGAHVT